MARVLPLVEVSKTLESGESLCLQQAVYQYDDAGCSDLAFRFIRRDIDGKLKAQRGQAGIPELDDAIELIKKMKKKLIKKMK